MFWFGKIDKFFRKIVFHVLVIFFVNVNNIIAWEMFSAGLLEVEMVSYWDILCFIDNMIKVSR